MNHLACDLAVIGSGFGGTLLALIARQLGYKVVLLERGSHPRFAIGESSTPLADFKLAAIADRFGLDWLRSFSKYATWKATHPQVRCGLKRGFSFFRHTFGQLFAPHATNDNFLLVAASPDDGRADTHWFRADFDHYLVQRAVEAGVAYLDRLEIHALRRTEVWRLEASRADAAVQVSADFLVDATGDGQLSCETLGLATVDPSALRTRSRALFGHFTGVARWHDLLREGQGGETVSRHPFPCDAAALHHVIDGGWMWVLRFDHGVTSAGFSLDPDVHPIRDGESPDAEWQRLLGSYPSLARQFAAAEAMRPLARTGRLQRRVTRASGSDWALLPHAAGFLDAWLSPGIAQTLFAVERLARILADGRQGARREQRLVEYGEAVLRELAWVDEITGTCFACFDRFEVMASVSMLYFVAAICCEERERAGNAPPDAAFLLADEVAYRKIAEVLCGEAPSVPVAEAARFAAKVRRLLKPYDRFGLCDPDWSNLIPFVTASQAV